MAHILCSDIEITPDTFHRATRGYGVSVVAISLKTKYHLKIYEVPSKIQSTVQELNHEDVSDPLSDKR